jgi:hypothetical protein
MSSKTGIFFTIRAINQFMYDEWLDIVLILTLLPNSLLLLLQNDPILTILKMRGADKS